MSMPTRTALTLLTAAILASCGDDDPEARSPGLVCPSCQVAGGESHDWGSRLAPALCSSAWQPYDDGRAEALGVAEARARVEGSLRASLRWVVNEPLFEGDLGERPAWLTTRPSGFDEHTTLAARITLDDPMLFAGYELADPVTQKKAAPGTCPDFAIFPATLALSTGDGGLSGAVLKGELRLALDQPPVLMASANLSEVYGSLNLHLASDFDRNGWLDATIQMPAEGPSGTVEVELDGKPVIAAHIPDDACQREASESTPESCAADQDETAVDPSEIEEHPTRIDAYDVTTDVPPESVLFNVVRDLPCDPAEQPPAPEPGGPQLVSPPSMPLCARYYFLESAFAAWCVVPDADSFDDYEVLLRDEDGGVILDDAGLPLAMVPRGVTPLPGSEHCHADGIATGPNPDNREAGYYPSKFCRVPKCTPTAE